MGNQMTPRIRRGLSTTTVATVLAVGLVACGQAPEAPSGGTVAQSDGATSAPTGDSNGATATETATTSPVTTATPTPTPTAAATATASPMAKPTPRPKRSKTATPEPTPSATATPKPQPSETPPPKPTTPKPTREDLRVGDHGPAVLKLQQRLSELGYWLGEPDGDFGFLTQQAVWALQKSAGLSRDGKVGPRTQRALADGIRPSTNLSGNGVDINLSRQILMIVRDGRVKYILNTSTGGGYEYEQKDGDTVTARTPKGTFRVYYTVDGRDEGFLGEMWRPRYFHGGYAVHGSPSIPSYPASHGCARVSNAAMNLIWSRDYMPKGSTVLVR